MKHKPKRIALICLLGLASVIIFCIWQNNDIVTTHIHYTNPKIPNNFDGYRILQVSDLHNKEFGENQSGLLNIMGKLEPDMIVVTGDLIDSDHTDIDVAMAFINGAVDIAPVYYVSGNHEAWSTIYSQLTAKLTDAGVVLLDDKNIQIEKNGSFIELIGLSDPSFTPSDYL